MQGEYVRSELRAALFDMPTGGRNQVVVMADMSAGDSYTSKLTRTVETDDTAVDIDAEHIRYRLGKKFTQNKPLINEVAFRTGVWRQLVNKLHEPKLSWVNYCYAENLKYDHQMIICKEVWERFQRRVSESGQKKMLKKTADNVSRMVWLAVQIAVSGIRGRPQEYKVTDLCRLIGVAPDNWLKHYAARWDLLLALCEELDNEVIGYVAGQHKAECSIRRRARMLM